MNYIKTTMIVAIAHVAVVGGIMLTSKSAKAKEVEDDKKALNEPYTFVGVDDVPAPKEQLKPQATPVPSPTPKPVATPVPKPVEKPRSSDNDWPRPKLHIVSKGDTFYGLVKKYKLNPDKFKKINNIKDPNKIVLGKKLILP